MSAEQGKEQQENVEIRKSIVIEASPEVIFKAITEPNELTKWFPDQAILELKVGGKMKLSFFKTDSEYRQMDYFPEGTICIPDSSKTRRQGSTTKDGRISWVN